MVTRDATPTREPLDAPWTPEEALSARVRAAAAQAAGGGVSLDLALAEVRFAFEEVAKHRDSARHTVMCPPGEDHAHLGD